MRPVIVVSSDDSEVVEVAEVPRRHRSLPQSSPRSSPLRQMTQAVDTSVVVVEDESDPIVCSSQPLVATNILDRFINQLESETEEEVSVLLLPVTRRRQPLGKQPRLVVAPALPSKVVKAARAFSGSSLKAVPRAASLGVPQGVPLGVPLGVPPTATRTKSLDHTPRALALANKASHTKDELLSRMTLHLAPVLRAMLSQQVEGFEAELAPATVATGSGIHPIVSWSLHCTSRYDASTLVFLPCEPYSQPMATTVLCLTGNQFISHLAAKSLPNHSLVMVVGYDKALAKARLSASRQFQNQVRQAMAGQESALPTAMPLTEEEILDQVVELQLAGVSVFPVNSAGDAVQWLRLFTHTMAKEQTKAPQNELAGVTGVPSGASPAQSYAHALRQVKMVTEGVAAKIAVKYDTFWLLQRAVHNKGGLGRGPDGKPLVSESVERRLVKVFMSDHSEDVVE